ncbi:MAG: replicative DNA helicase, partial [Hyphomonadaceae bacterium]|nr:replicative DNA helicase [Clostridia bacterium]
AQDDVSYIMEQAEKRVIDILQRKNTTGLVPVRSVLRGSMDKMMAAFEQQGKITGVPSGFIDLDMKLNGLQPSDLVLVAARPAMGKTSFALNIAQYAATHNNTTVAVFSLEMSKEQLVNRLLWSQALIPSNKIRTGELDSKDWKEIAYAMGVLSDAPLYIDDMASIKVLDIRAKCRRLQLEKNLGLVVIDYLQLIQESGKSSNRQEEVARITRSLKILAKELNVPVVVLSQLSRAAESRADHRPMLSDLRESGAIEQDADIVMFLYRDDYYNPDTTEKPGVAECIIAKHRNGSTGTVEMRWMGEYTKFANLAKS